MIARIGVPLTALALVVFPASADPRAEIEQVVESAYIEGVHVERDGERIRAGFHESFHMYVSREGEVSVVSLEDWIGKIEGWRAAEPTLDFELDWKLPRVDVTGDTAVAQVEVLRDGELVFTDYLSLYRFDEGWRIVAKIFHDHR